MPLLTKEQIQSFTPKTEDVDVPEVGTFRLREPSAGIVAETFDGGPLGSKKAMRLLAHSLVGEDGRPMFVGTKAVEELSEVLPARAYQPLIEKVIDLAGMGEDAVIEDDQENPSEAGE